VFNAEAIWQAPGLALFSRRPLLRDLLERSPREQRGRAATRCFSHVTLMLPQEEVDDDRHLTRGARVRDLAQSLAALHQKDFGDLLGGDEVRYDVVGAERSNRARSRSSSATPCTCRRRMKRCCTRSASRATARSGSRSARSIPTSAWR
jgi:hypothetical protein